jgi:hypothetical protein
MGIRAGEAGKTLKLAVEKFVTVTAEIWKGFTRDAKLYCAAGEDSVPVKDDQILLIKIDGTGKYIALGVLDVSQGAKPGEKILFARDADGNIKSKLSMLESGAVEVETEGDYKETIKGDSVSAVDGKSEKKAEGDIVEESGGKFYFGNGSQNLCKVLTGLIDEIKKIKTFGAPPQHQLMPDTAAALENYKRQVQELLKESK